jgi:hypothetical protein
MHVIRLRDGSKGFTTSRAYQPLPNITMKIAIFALLAS